jgi:hypothetical protein
MRVVTWFFVVAFAALAWTSWPGHVFCFVLSVGCAVAVFLLDRSMSRREREFDRLEAAECGDARSGEDGDSPVAR